MTELTQCVADGGLINPALFPAKSADLDTSRISGSASSLRTMGQSVEDKTEAIKTAWDRLGGSYEAPEQEKVFAVMNPAVTSAQDLRTAFSSAAGHLDTYASALAGIKPRLADLERRAREFRASVIDGVWVDASASSDAGFGDHMAWAFDWVPGVDERRVKVPWNEDGETVEKNTALLEEYGQILADISAASATCANAVNGLVTNVCVAPVEAIPAEAFTSGEVPMPWGNPVVEDRNCRESVGSGAYTFGKDLVQGLGMLVVGYNPENGDWFSGDAYGQAWGGLGDLVGSLVLMASPVGWVAAGMAATGNNDNAFSDFMYDRAVTLRNAGGALVGWDPNAEDGWHAWKEDGLAAGTAAVLNVGTFFIPGAGQVTGGLKAGSAGAKLALITGKAAEFAVQGGSWLVRGGVKVIVGLDSALAKVVSGLGRLGDNIQLPGPQLATAGGGAVAGGGSISLRGLLTAMVSDAGSRGTPPTVRPHTPLSDATFGPRPGAAVPDVTPPTRPSGSTALPDVDGSGPRVPDTDATPGSTHGSPGSTSGAPGSTDGTPVRDPQSGTGSGAPHPGTSASPSPHAPAWTDGTLPDGRPDVSQVPREHWNDPAYDPSHPHYDGTPRGEHGNVGTVDPDVPSASGLTNSGRLLDPAVIPEPLRPFVENGTIVNDNGVLRLAETVDVPFKRRDANHDLAEFERQLDLQERALNQMAVGGWAERFDNFLRLDNQDTYRAQQITLLADRLEIEHSLTREEAVTRATRAFQDQHPLHGPDQRAGGDPDQFTGMGDGNVNMSIGAQWPKTSRAGALRAGIAEQLAEMRIPPELWGDVRLNVRLTLQNLVRGGV